MGREHPATCRSGQTLVVAHARVNQREEVSANAVLFEIANENVEIINHLYIYLIVGREHPATRGSG
nr:hypothetical protein [Ectobacillus panaciterrae]